MALLASSRVLLALALLAAAVTGGAGSSSSSTSSPPAAPADDGAYHTCSLYMEGRGEGSRELAKLQLECTPPAAGGGAPLTVEVNGSLVPPELATRFRGVEVVRDTVCRRNATGDRKPRYPVLYFCGDYGVRFDRPVVRRLWLPPAGELDAPDTRTGALLFGGGVRAVLAGGDLSDNTVSSVVTALGPRCSLRVEAATVARNRGWIGAGLIAYNGSRVDVVGGSRFEGNVAGSAGAAMRAWAPGTSVAIDGATFLNNSAHKDNGGAVFFDDGANASVTNCTFTGNAATNGSGGALQVSKPGTSVVVIGTTFAHNTANWTGGAFAISEANVSIASSTFIGNKALDNGGGAIALTSDNSSLASALSVSDSMFANNTSNGLGGAVAADGPPECLLGRAPNGTSSPACLHMSLTNCTLVHNNGTAGGGVGVQNCTLSVADSNVSSNQAKFSTAALDFWSTPSIPNALSAATGQGGGIATYRSRVTIRSTLVETNTALLDGGGVALCYSSATINSTSISRNSVQRDGGGVFLNGTEARLASTSVSGNFAFVGGGLFVSATSNVTVNESSLVANNVAAYGGGLFGEAAADNGGNASAAASSAAACAPGSTGAPQLIDLAGTTFANNNASGTGSHVHVGPSHDLCLARSNLPAPDGRLVVWQRTKCFIGEEIVEGVSPFCQPCPAFQYSLDAGRVGSGCQPCNPLAAHCPGGAVIVAEDGFWSGNGTKRCAHCSLDNIMRCPNPKACKHSVAQLAGLHPNNASAMQHSSYTPDQVAANYSQALCTASPRAYTGVLCGSCRRQLYGQTAPFACNACLGVDETRGRTSPNSPGIITLFVLYCLWFVVFVLATTWATLMANAESRDEAVSRHGSNCSANSRTASTLSGSGQSASARSASGAGAKGGGTPVRTWSGALGSFNSSRSSIGGVVDTDMHAMHVIKAFVMYVQYARIVINLPISWWPDPLSKMVGAVSEVTDDSKRSTQYWSWLLGWPASLDCLFWATGHDLGVHQAGVKNLINLLAPLAILAATTLCQAAWWCVRHHAGRWLRAAMDACPVPHLAKQWLGRVADRLGERREMGGYLRQHMIVAALVTIFWWYPTIASVALSSFACVSVCPAPVDGAGGADAALCTFWVPDMTQACPLHSPRSAAFGWAVGVGVPALAVCAAVPVMIVALLSRAASEGRLEHPEFIELFGFLYLDYRFGGSERRLHVLRRLKRFLRRCSCWQRRRALRDGSGSANDVNGSAGCAATVGSSISWGELGARVERRLVLVWNAVIHLQTLLLVCLAVFGTLLHEFFQAVIIAAMLSCFLLFVMWLRPFRALAIQRLQALLLVVLCATTLCILVLVRPEGLDARQLRNLPGAQAAARWAVFVMNLCFIGFAFSLLLVCLVRKWRELRRQLRRQQGSRHQRLRYGRPPPEEQAA